MNSKLENACFGKTASKGGLNLSDMRMELIALFPKDSKKIKGYNRKALEGFCRRKLKLSKANIESSYFIEGTPLNDSQMSYCKCLAHVAAKNPEWCYRHGAWKTVRPGTPCYNPYAVCTKSTRRRGSFPCTKYYDFENMPEDEVRSLAMMKGLSVPNFIRMVEGEREE